MKQFLKENGVMILLSTTIILTVFLGLFSWIMCAVSKDLVNVVYAKDAEIEELKLAYQECRQELIESKIIIDNYDDLIDRGYLIENYPNE